MPLTAEQIRQNFNDKKNNIVNLLKDVANFYHNQEEADKKHAFDKLAEDLENGEFSIVVVGEFSAGKSTFLNALMGNRLLPSYKNETTATVNFLKHTNKQTDAYRGKVFFNDGKCKELTDINLDIITKYVSTRGEKTVISKVKYLELYLDSNFLKDGVTLVDTPGLNGTAEGHREITEQQILKSHASIFVFSGDHPGTATEFTFLEELRKKVKTIFLIMNKIDDINADEGETPDTVVQSLRKNYKLKFPDATKIPEIWPLAALPALVARSKEKVEYHNRIDWSDQEKKELEEKSLLADFETRLMRFLTQGEKSRAELLAPLVKIIDVMGESRDFLEKEIEVLNGQLNSDDLNNEICLLEDGKLELEKNLSKNKTNVKKLVREKFKEMNYDFECKINNLKNNIVQQICGYDNLEDLSDFCKNLNLDLQNKINRFALDADEKMRENIREIILIQFDKYSDDIDDNLHKIVSNIKVEIQDQLNIDIINFGIEAIEERRNQLKEEIKQLEQKKQQAEQDVRTARRIKNKNDRLNNEIKDLENELSTIRFQLANGLPPKSHYSKQETEYVARGGLFGFFTDILVGKKERTKIVDVIDSEDHDRAEQILNEKARHIQSELNSKKNELKENDQDNIDEAENNSREIDMAINSLLEKMTEQTKRDQEEIQNKFDREIKKITSSVENYCDNIITNINQSLKKEFYEAEKAYVNLINNIISSDLSREIENEKKKIESLKSKMQGAINNKNEQINELQSKIKDIEEFITKAIEMKSAISAETIDVIDEFEL